MNDKTKTTDKADDTGAAKAKTVSALALHTVTRADGMGGKESNPRGTIFQAEVDELERLKRVGAARAATAEEIKAAKGGATVAVNEPASGSYSQTAAAGRAAAEREVAEYEGEDETGGAKTKASK